MTIHGRKLFALSKDNTLVAKGFAVLLLLWHHLFYSHPEYGAFVHRSALYSRVCVHVFVILSGYGIFCSLTRWTNEKIEIKYLSSFYWERFVKLMPAYWLVFAIGVPVSMLMGKMLADVFPSSVHPWWRLVMSFFGVHMLNFAGWGYNPTWWYMTLQLGLYLIAPFIFVQMKSFPLATWIILSAGVFCHCIILPGIGKWLMPFATGMMLARVFGEQKCYAIGHSCFVIMSSAGLLSIGCFLLLNSRKWPGYMLIALGFILLSKVCSIFPIINRTLAFLGKHSYNIFLLHTLLNHLDFLSIHIQLQIFTSLGIAALAECVLVMFNGSECSP